MEGGYDLNMAWIQQHSVCVCKAFKEMRPNGLVRLTDISNFLRNNHLGYSLASYMNVSFPISLTSLTLSS